MTINNLGQVTNANSDYLLSEREENYIKTLMDDGKSTDLSMRYAKAIFFNHPVPAFIIDQAFDTLEEAFELMATLEYVVTHTSDFDSYELAMLKELWYYFGEPKWAI